jgi:hypothetical protein
MDQLFLMKRDDYRMILANSGGAGTPKPDKSVILIREFEPITSQKTRIPDLAAVALGLSGGLPISATLRNLELPLECEQTKPLYPHRKPSYYRFGHHNSGLY